MSAKQRSPISRKYMEDLAESAGRVLLKYYRRRYKVEHKQGEGIVTEADKAAETQVIKNILRKYPNSSIIAEESGEYQGDNSLCWVIDPLDGTTNFAHGFPWFCVSIGVTLNGKLHAGVVHHPTSNDTYFAMAGKGAYLGRKKLSVSKTHRLNASLLGTGFYYKTGDDLRREMAPFERLNDLAQGVRRPGAAALDLACVASGSYDGFWERGLKPWDVAAGFLLIEEAGGKITNYKGEKTDIFESEVLASNGKLHKALIEQM